jgi:hypothetical protein
MRSASSSSERPYTAAKQADDSPARRQSRHHVRRGIPAELGEPRVPMRPATVQIFIIWLPREVSREHHHRASREPNIGSGD